MLPAINAVLEQFPKLGGAVLTVGESMMEAGKAILPLLGDLAMMGGSKGLAGVLPDAGDVRLDHHVGGHWPGGGVGDGDCGVGRTILLTAAAVAALLVVLYKLVGGWEGVKDIMASVMVFFQDIYTIVVGFTKDAIEKLISGIQGVVTWFKNLGTGTMGASLIVQGFIDIFEQLWGVAQKAWGIVEKVFKAIGKEVSTLAESYRKADAQGKKNTETTEKQTEAYIRTVHRDGTASAASLTGGRSLQVADQNAGRKHQERVGRWADRQGESIHGAGRAVWRVRKFGEKADDVQERAGPQEGGEGQPPCQIQGRRERPRHQRTDECGGGGATDGDDAGSQRQKSVRNNHPPRGLKGEFEKLPPAIREMGAAWDEQQFAKTKVIHDKVKELVTAFSSKMTEGVRASSDAVQQMQDDMTASTLRGADARMFAIQRQEKAALKSIDNQTKAVDDGLKAEISKVLAASAERRKVVQEDTNSTAEAQSVWR